MNFEPIPNLPFGSILCCFQAKGKIYKEVNFNYVIH